MDFKHKSPPPNVNYSENIYRSPYNNESMLHHINSIPKEQHYQQQHMSVYDYSNNQHQQNKNIQNMFVNRHYSHRSPSVVRRRRCRSECLSPSLQYHDRYSSNSPRNGHNQISNGYYNNVWPVHRSIEQEQNHERNNYEYQVS